MIVIFQTYSNIITGVKPYLLNLTYYNFIDEKSSNKHVSVKSKLSKLCLGVKFYPTAMPRLSSIFKPLTFRYFTICQYQNDIYFTMLLVVN